MSRKYHHMQHLFFAVIASAFLLSGCASRPPADTLYSEWSFQCRKTGEYFYEDRGTLKTGKQPVDDSYLWISEATDTRKVRLRNKQTGHYLSLDASGKVVSADGQDAPADNLLWEFQGFNFRQMANCSWYTLSNTAAGQSRFLEQTGTGIGLQETDRNKNFAAHWTIVREKGSPSPFAIYPDSVVEASYLGTRVSRAVSATKIISDYHEKGRTWELSKDISAFPQFTADHNTMLVALYNMALQEMQLNLRSDSTFSAGALWPDTWTRDAVYSIYFAFAWIQPEVSLKTLRKQTLKKLKEALQDTGSGGSWPISTDRVVWALAAWEYYISTGDQAWLAEAYENLSNTARKDMHVAFDEQIGLFKGEACSMDWRTHTYPNWFSNENIGESFSSGTNALHLFSYDFLERAGTILGRGKEEIAGWKNIHDRVKQGLNRHFWNPEKGLYASYLYPAFMQYRPSDRVDIMSNGLCALLGAADSAQVKSILEKYPLYPYGGAVLYPSIPDDFAYHNKSVWTVWQTPLLYAAKRSGNLAVVDHLMRSQIRQGAMFLTHKENMTYDTGSDENTALNSDRQLWSVASYISMVYRLIFGLDMTAAGLSFSPAIPKELVNGKVNLKNFRYREAVLDITVNGTGDMVQTLKVNGVEQSLPYVLPADAKGQFNIEIVMATRPEAKQGIHLVEAGPGKCWSPVEPEATLENGRLNWTAGEGLTYKVFGPGMDETATPPVDLRGKSNGFYSVYAVDSKGFQSDLSNPVLQSGYTGIVETEAASGAAFRADTASGFSGTGYIRDFSERPADVVFECNLPKDGDYAFSLRGSNGRGPHEVYCYIRSVSLDGKDSGSFILEASGNWSQWTHSNQLIVRNMKAGKHRLQLQLNPEQKGFDNNMSYTKEYRNDAYIDCLQVVKL